MSEQKYSSLPALWVSTVKIGESDALVNFFALPDGAVTAKARGLSKETSKLAQQLKSADELKITLTSGRGQLPILTGAVLHRAHPEWQADLNLLALAWFFAECAFIGSGPEELNADVFQLIVNLLRDVPVHFTEQITFGRTSRCNLIDGFTGAGPIETLVRGREGHPLGPGAFDGIGEDLDIKHLHGFLKPLGPLFPDVETATL